MRKVETFLQKARANGVTFSIDGGLLRYSSPSGSLSAHDHQEIRLRKEEIVDFLRQASQIEPASSPPPTARETDGPVRASFAQERLWFLDQLGLV
ncbi:hypothetical protein, partial [Xanthomonas arboricola]|uniref:TubC N-terminal docking domain-related protein n=1 Tax=Xanthomonas arboricola TaxID=56448 RepID=UPI000D49B28B